jgi:hypothetical protein
MIHGMDTPDSAAEPDFDPIDDADGPIAASPNP